MGLCVAGAVGVAGPLWRDAAQAWAARELADAAERRPFDTSAVAALASDVDPGSNAEGWYAKARVEAMLAAAQAEAQGVHARGALGAAAEASLRRAAALRPAWPWPAATLARHGSAGTAAERWQALAAAPQPAPEFQKAKGDGLLALGARDGAVAAYRLAAAGRPEWTRALLRELAAAGVPWERRQAVAPNDPQGAWAGVEHAVHDERLPDAPALAAAALARLGAPRGRGADDRVALARLAAAAGQVDFAAAEAAAAVRLAPTADRWLLLAELRYRQQRYDDCAAAAEQLVRRDPNSADAVLARQWQNKARAMRAGQDAP